jgi:hypothetical protein
VDADVVVDDELEPRQADAFIGQLAELEGELRIADVHHDLGLSSGIAPVSTSEISVSSRPS